MNKGKLSDYKRLARLFLVTAAVSVCVLSTARAQQGNPEVYVDMGVLQGLGSGTTQEQQTPVILKPPVLRPPVATSVQPRLIAPTQQAPAYVPPPPVKQVVAPKPLPAPAIKAPVKQYVSTPPQMPADEVHKAVVSKPLKSAPPPPAAILEPVKPLAVIDPTPIIPEVKPEMEVEIKAENKPEPVAFPIKTKVRAETSDPAAANTSRPVPVRTGIAGNLKDIVPSRPAPDFDPAAEVASTPAEPLRDLTEEPAALTTTGVRPAVIPGRKPVIETKITEEKRQPEPPVKSEVQKAPPELVAELRAREEKKKEPKKSEIDLANPPPPPGPMGKKNMPAVAKAKVDSEQLAEQTIKLPVQSDPLLDSLVERDKGSLVATIESMVAEREDGKPLKTADKPKRELGTNIVKAEPIQRPYNVYRPQNQDVADDKDIPRPPAPRSEDEQAYVSVPFAGGLTELDAKIIQEIESRLLPVLNDNPGWKLQIQAFASPVKDGVSSARKASLERALSVRTYLISKGIEATRMDVRALGAESDRDPMDRVDLIVFDPAKKG